MRGVVEPGQLRDALELEIFAAQQVTRRADPEPGHELLHADAERCLERLTELIRLDSDGAGNVPAPELLPIVAAHVPRRRQDDGSKMRLRDRHVRERRHRDHDLLEDVVQVARLRKCEDGAPG